MSTDPKQNRLTVVQVLPALEMGGVERGTLEVARRLVREGHRSIVISAGGRLVEQLQAEGSTHLAWDVGAKRLATLRWIPKLRRFLRETRPDVLHLRSRLPAWIAYLAWKGLSPAERPVLVTTVHGFYRPGWYSSIMMRGERIIAISASVRDHILKNYPRLDETRIRIIHRGVDPTLYPYGYTPPESWLESWRAQIPELEGKYILTFPARLSRRKGHEDFIDVIAGLRQAGIPAHGLIVGGTHPHKRHYEVELRERIREQNLGAALTLLGHRSDLSEIMAVSDVVLSLSREPEAFGRVSLEALSLGRPVLAYDHGGVGEQLAEIFPEGRVPVGDQAQVVERLRAWYRTPPVVPARQPFTLERMLTATLEVYQDAVAARDSRS